MFELVAEQNWYSHRREGIRRDKMVKEIKERGIEVKLWKSGQEKSQKEKKGWGGGEEMERRR